MWTPPRIVRRLSLAEDTFLWEVEAPEIARAAQAGQFVIVRLHEGGERVPLTLADFDAEAGRLVLVVQAVGRTTRTMRDAFAEGDAFADLAGPLGEPAALDAGPGQRVVLVGGGLGVAPLFPLARGFRSAGAQVTVVLGFRTAARVFWVERFAEVSDAVVVCTEDGSAGRVGRVTAPLEALCAEPGTRPDRVVTVGPLAMMRACAEVTRPWGVPSRASVNTLMVDGTGMCGACRLTVGGEVRFACVDGPEFDAHLIDFAALEARQARFAAAEARARDDYAHVCHLEAELHARGHRPLKKIREVAPTRTPMAERPAADRVRRFDEVSLGYTPAEALAEAERCLQCAHPPCVDGCPVGVDVPGFIRQLLVRDVDAALGRLHAANPFPALCGRVCPQERQCEAACVLGRVVEPVAIGRLERFTGDHGHPQVNADTPPASVHGRVAVIGSGPAGLTCAADLVARGVEVTVFEALHVVGGVLRYGIPAFRLPREVIDREVGRLRAQGVRFETDRVGGRTFTLASLRGPGGFDAVFIAVGAGAPVFLGLPGEDAPQVVSANEFLTRVNLMEAADFPLVDTPPAVGRDVVVLGAGNTAMDCLRVARRLGAETVRCVYRRTEAEVPARAEELRHAREEGVEFVWLAAPAAIEVDASGDVCGLVVEEMSLGEPDARGRRAPTPTGTRRTLRCDMVIYALGTQANPLLARTSPGLAVDGRGHIVADAATCATNLPGVYAGGDIVTGGATVVSAMGAGRRAARAIVEALARPDRIVG